MPSPITAASITILSEVAKVCDRLQALLDLPAQVKSLLGWLLDDTGNLSDATLEGSADRILPVGSLIGYLNNATLPSNKWQFAVGQELIRADYPTLFLRIGITYGPGNGTTTFNLPDYRDKTLVGVGVNAMGSSIGSATGSVSLPPHKHYFGAPTGTNDDVFLYTDLVNTTGPGTNAIRCTCVDASGNPPSTFMSNINSQGLITNDPVGTVTVDNPTGIVTVTVPTQSPALVAAWIIKVL